jgi:hypothetical protein
MRRIPAGILLLVAACTPAPPPAPPPAPVVVHDEADVLAVIDRLFDAMRAGDSATVRAVFHPAATLMTIPSAGGAPILRTSEVDDFIDAVGSVREEVWDERTWEPVVHVDGHLATAWMQYAFHVDEQLSHCGVNAFHLFRSAEGWRIIHIADTRRREGCGSRGQVTP